MKKARKLGEIIEAVHRTLKHWEVSEADTDVWFRGVDRASHSLLPKFYRGACEDLDEDNLLYRFEAFGATLLPYRPDKWEWYFIAQHYGLPTRLLDWTDNLHAAVYFALKPFYWNTPLSKIVGNAKTRRGSVGDPADPPAIWVLDAANLNKTTVAEEAILVPGGELTDLWKPEVLKRGRVLSKRVKRRRITNGRPIAVLPPRTTTRIIAQQGLFTIHGSGQRPLDFYYGRKAGQRLAQVLIDPKSASAIWRDLSLCGINHFSVFPDLTNLAKHVYLSNA